MSAEHPFIEKIMDLERRLRESQADCAAAVAAGHRAHDRAELAEVRVKEREEALRNVVAQGTWQHRCSDGVGGCTAISEAILSEARAVLGEGNE